MKGFQRGKEIHGSYDQGKDVQQQRTHINKA